MPMDSKKAADRLRELADQIEKTQNLQGVAIIMPPGNVEPLEIIIAGSEQPNFSQYIAARIYESAAAPGLRSPQIR